MMILLIGNEKQKPEVKSQKKSALYFLSSVFTACRQSSLPIRQAGALCLRSALTLLELLLVIVIISVLLGLSIPHLNKSIKNSEFKSFADKTYLFLDYAKNRAIIKAVILQMRFDQEKKQIVLEERETKQKIFRSVKVPDRINMQLSNEKIIFYPDGTLQKFEVVIYNDKRQITISSLGFDGKIILNEAK